MNETIHCFGGDDNTWFTVNGNYRVFFHKRGSVRFTDISIEDLLTLLIQKWAEDEPALLVDEVDNSIHELVPRVKIVEYTIKP